MNVNRITSMIAFLGGMALATAGAMAQDSARNRTCPLEKTIGQVKATGPVPSLAVINSAGATLEGGKLVLTGVSAEFDCVCRPADTGSGPRHDRTIHHAVG